MIIRCYNCGKSLDQHSLTNEAGVVDREQKVIPKENDFCICAYCAEVTVVTKIGGRKPTDDELDEIRSNKVICKTVEVIKEYWRRRRDGVER